MNQKLELIAKKDSELRLLIEAYATNPAKVNASILKDLTDQTENYELMIKEFELEQNELEMQKLEKDLIKPKKNFKDNSIARKRREQKL